MGLYVVYHVFPYGVVETADPDTREKFKVNDQRLKKFSELPSAKDMDCLVLREPVSDE